MLLQVDLKEDIITTLEINIYPVDEHSETLLELYPIKPSNQILPEWYKKQKTSKRGSLEYSNLDYSNMKKAKQCPAIQDIVSEGFIIPSWQDVYFIKQGNHISWRVYADQNKEATSIGVQGVNQLTDMPTNHLPNYGILKFICPYFFSTPPGYGIYFADPFYHFRKDVKILPGKVETDIWHEVNFPFEFYKPFEEWEDGEMLFIKAGEPLVQIALYDKNLNKGTLNLNALDKNFLEQQEKNQIISSTVSQSFPAYKAKKNNEI